VRDKTRKGILQKKKKKQAKVDKRLLEK